MRGYLSSRTVTRKIEHYNLDVVIAVGYRVNSYQATQFRIWATRTWSGIKKVAATIA